MRSVALSYGYRATKTGKRLKLGTHLPRFDLLDASGTLVWSFGGLWLEMVVPRMEEEVRCIEVDSSSAFDLRGRA